MEQEEFKKEFCPWYSAWEEAVEQLNEDEQWLIYKRAFRYCLYGDEPENTPGELSKLGNIFWDMIFPVIKKSRNKAVAGHKGGETKGKINNPNGNNQHPKKG